VPTFLPFYLFLFKDNLCYIYMAEVKFWCDRCYTNKLNLDNQLEKCFFSCKRTDQMRCHLASKKHIKEMSREKTDDDIECKYCGQFFTKEGYEIHKERNIRLWQIAGVMKVKCNHFVYNKKRFSNYDKMINSVV
jgi:hypothetical protein